MCAFKVPTRLVPEPQKEGGKKREQGRAGGASSLGLCDALGTSQSEVRSQGDRTTAMVFPFLWLIVKRETTIFFIP